MITTKDMKSVVSVVALGTMLGLFAPEARAAMTCESMKLRGSGLYSQCRINAEAAYRKSDRSSVRLAAREESYRRCHDLFQRAIGLAMLCEAATQHPFLRFAEDDVKLFLDTCASNLAADRPSIEAGNGLLSTGQTTAWGPGSDGDLRRGTPHSWIDNGDGTVTDVTLGLMWEKKSRDGSIHDRDRGFSWGTVGPPAVMDGTMVGEFLGTLNAPPCFAGHCDWRIPNRRELLSLVDRERHHPAAFGIFDSACVDGCTVLDCSCTASLPHFTSSPDENCFSPVWTVDFASGDTPLGSAATSFPVRAVRDVPAQDPGLPPVEERLCASAKLTAASKYSRCRLVADAVFSRSTKSAAALERLEDARARCDRGIEGGYAVAERKYGASCPKPGDLPEVEAFVARFAEDVGAYRHFTGLTGLLRTGITRSCGPGSDGDLRRGMARSVTSNEDGTIDDNQTGLMWELKTRDGSIHDVNAFFTWNAGGAPWTMNGTVLTSFLATLNTPPCFAGHCDWRLPNWTEVESLQNLYLGLPYVNDGSLRGDFFSSTTVASDPSLVWGIDAHSSSAKLLSKIAPARARAVRDGR